MAEKIEAWKSVDGSIHESRSDAYMKDAEYYKTTAEKLAQLAKQQAATIAGFERKLKASNELPEAKPTTQVIPQL